MASHYEEIRKAYIAEQPTYRELCTVTVDILSGALREAGIRAEVTGRVKELFSFLTKTLRNPEYLSGAKSIQDKAGARVILPYFADEPVVGDILDRHFFIDEREETVERLGADKLGYLAVHYIARPKPEFLNEEQVTLFDGLQIEVQVGSMAQRAWAEVSHEQIYKPAIDVPEEYKRMINRLMALVELFDDEVGRVRARIASLPGFEVTSLLDQLDRELLRFTGQLPDRLLSQQTVPPLAATYPEPPSSLYNDRIKPWIAANRERLAELYARYGADFTANPLFFQPEALLIYERAESDPTALGNAWPGSIPREPLVSLTELWGAPLD